MIRCIITLLLAVSVSLTASAENILSVASSSGQPGEEVEVVVSLSGGEMPVAIEMNIPLDEALTYVHGSAILNPARSDGSHSISAAERNGMLNIVIYSASLDTLQGSEGELCRFKLEMGREPGEYSILPNAVLSNASGNKLSSTVTGGTVTLLSPKIEVLTPAINFGSIPIRGVYTKTLQLRNTGTEPLEITTVETNRSDMTAGAQQYTIAPGNTQDVILTYSPTVRGAVETKINIASNAINPKAGTAKVTAAPFSVNELHVQRAEGRSDEEVTVVLKMNNMEPIVAAQCEFTLPDDLVYVAGSAAAGSRCDDTDHSALGVMNGKRLTLMLYSPSNTALPEGDGNLLTFRLRLNGYNGSYRITPENVVLSNSSMENMTSATTSNYVVIKSPKLTGNSVHTFNEVPVEQMATTTYDIRNTGNIDLVIKRVEFLNDGYAIVEELPVIIPQGKTKSLTITHTPASEGEFSTIMQVYSDDPENRMHSVSVSGMAYEDNRISVKGNNTEDGYRLAFALDNYSEITAIQMTVKWLPGMKTSLSELTPTERIEDHSVLVTDRGNGIYQILVYSMDNTSITGHSGDLFTIDYIADEGTAYRNTTISVENIVLSNSTGKNKSSLANLETSAEYTHFWLSYVLDGDTISREFVEAGTALEYPVAPERPNQIVEWQREQTVSRAIDIAGNADEMLYTNAPSTYAGEEFAGWNVLFDNDASTCFYSERRYVNSQDGLDHYIRVDLGEENKSDCFSFTYTTRNVSPVHYAPAKIIVEGSNQPNGTYVTIATLTELPVTGNTVYTSDTLTADEPYRYIRFSVKETKANSKAYGHPYFNIAEFGMAEYVTDIVEGKLTEMPASDISIEGVYVEYYQKGDANGDGSVLVNDVVYTINYILNEEADDFRFDAADMTEDGDILINDVVLIVNKILGIEANGAFYTPRHMNAFERLNVINSGINRFDVSLSNASRYTAMQFDMELAEGADIADIKMSMSTDHSVAYRRIDDTTVRVVVTSLTNEALAEGAQLCISMKDAAGKTVAFTNGRAACNNGQMVGIMPGSTMLGGTTGIDGINAEFAPADVYSIDGRIVKKNATTLDGLKRGVYVINGQKVVKL